MKFGVIVDVEASRSIRQAEVGAARTMIERTEERFGLKPERLVGDTAYGAAPMLNWLVEEKGIAPHIPVFDKSKRDDGTFSRSDFRYDPTDDVYHRPGGKRLGTRGTVHEGKGAWRDNVFVERLWKSIKYEEVYLRAYDNVGEARASIGRYLDFYNGRRPHQSLDDATPDQAYFNQPPFRLAA